MLLLLGTSLVSISALSGQTAYAASTSQLHSTIRAETTLHNHQKLVSSTVVPAPASVKPNSVVPPETDCLTMWGEASSVQKFGSVANYNVQANLWNTCGAAIQGSSNGWAGEIQLECEGAWITQTGFDGSLPNMSANQQLVPLFFYNFKSTCIDSFGNVSLPQHIEVDVAAAAIRTDNNTDVSGAVTITVY